MTLMVSPDTQSRAFPVTRSFSQYRLAEHACRADLPELLAYVVDMHPSLLPCAPGETSLLHLCVQHGSLAAMASLLRMPAVQVTTLFWRRLQHASLSNRLSYV